MHTVNFNIECCTVVFMYIAITCPVSQSLFHATKSTNLALFGTVVQYQCTRGYHFPNNNTLLSIICEDDGQWNSTVTDCERKLSQF